jgi:hypothetical protein
MGLGDHFKDVINPLSINLIGTGCIKSINHISFAAPWFLQPDRYANFLPSGDHVIGVAKQFEIALVRSFSPSLPVVRIREK